MKKVVGNRAGRSTMAAKFVLMPDGRVGTMVARMGTLIKVLIRGEEIDGSLTTSRILSEKEAQKARRIAPGMAVRAALQSGVTILAEVVRHDGFIIIVKDQKGIEHRLMLAEII